MRSISNPNRGLTSGGPNPTYLVVAALLALGSTLAIAGCAAPSPRHRNLYAPGSGQRSLLYCGDRAMGAAEDAVNAADRFVDTVID